MAVPMQRLHLSDLAVVQGASEGGLVNDPAASHVHDARALLHLREGVVVEHALQQPRIPQCSAKIIPFCNRFLEACLSCVHQDNYNWRLKWHSALTLLHTIERRGAQAEHLIPDAGLTAPQQTSIDLSAAVLSSGAQTA